MVSRFWAGFHKRAYDLKSKEQMRTPELMERSITEGGPRLDALTTHSDRRKYRVFKG